MADLNPLRLWRRLLALPNDNRGKILAMAFAVAALSSLSISIAAQVLQPRIEANRAAEQQAKLAEVIAQLPELADILSGAGGDQLQSLVVDLRTGQATDRDPEGFDLQAMASDPETSDALEEAADIAGIGRRPNFARIYLLKSGSELELVILPVFATGYQSRIAALLALRGDLNTVAGLVITDQAETPGLGAEIANPAWQALWQGKALSDADGKLRLAVTRGPATSRFEVDGITGATRTGSAVSAMIAFWMGPDGYDAVLAALRQGAL